MDDEVNDFPDHLREHIREQEEVRQARAEYEEIVRHQEGWVALDTARIPAHKAMWFDKWAHKLLEHLRI